VSRKDYQHLYKTAHWLRLRKQQLLQHPLCAFCEKRGRVTPATVVDHVERHGGNPNLFFCSPLQSLCKNCHDVDKQRVERGGRPRQQIGSDGFPLD
jgi:hypothetical protein